jgi:HK97 family phage portal protein
MEGIVMTLMLYGKGNAVVVPHTWDGILRSLEPISAHRVSFLPVGTSYRDYKVMIDGRARDPESVLHFTYNPDKNYLWMGRGVDVSLRDLANNLKQASKTERGFMESKWKPSIIVKVDGLVDEFATVDGRKKLLNEYMSTSSAGEPWLIPADQFDIEVVKPLSLTDIALSDSVKLDKQTVASILGVPPFVVGIGEYKADEWNNFVNARIKPLCNAIEQELTRKLLISPTRYFKFNLRSLYSYDINVLATVGTMLYERGIMTGNEVRDMLNFSPLDGLDKLNILENYIPIDKIGDQNKLGGE